MHKMHTNNEYHSNKLERNLQEINCLETKLSEIKRKSTGILMLVEKIKQAKKTMEQGESAVTDILQILTSLDVCRLKKSEEKNKDRLEQATVMCLEMIKTMGGVEIQVEIGERIDEKKHCIAQRVPSEGKENRILKCLSRGFVFGDSIYPAYIVVSQNNASSGKREKKFNILDHLQYRQKVRKAFALWSDDPSMKKWLFKNYEALLQVFSLNFDPIRKKIESLYSPGKRGCPPYDPIALIRSLVLMLASGETSITKWVDHLYTSPMSAVVCGFEPDNSPSVGTYYFFMQRLEDGEYQKPSPYRILPHEIRQESVSFRIPKAKPKEKPEREPDPVDEQKKDVLKKLVLDIESKEKHPIPQDMQKLLNQILLEVVVKPSAARSLLGDLEKVIISGDGTTIPSGSSPHGKAHCDCRSKGIYRCEHPHKFSDKDARWGYDTLEGWVFGYRLYQFVCSTAKHDLPIYLNMNSCNTHEGVMYLHSMDRLRKQLTCSFPEMNIGYFTGDAIHDSYTIYHYNFNRNIQYAIPYAHKPSKCQIWPGHSDQPSPNESFLVNENGIPLCDAGLPMRYIGKNRHGNSAYACPIKRPTNCDGKRNVQKVYLDECPKGSLCSPDTKWAPCVSIASKNNPRLHPTIPRESQQYKELLNLRSGCERSNAQKKEHYKLKYNKSRVLPYVFIKATLISLLEHSKVWVKKDLQELKITKENVFSLFD